MSQSYRKNGTVLDAFVAGAKNGFQIASTVMAPNVIFAFALIQVFNLTGLLDIIGVVFEPIMRVFGIPGVAATALMAGWLSMCGGFGVAASLVTAGQLSPSDAAVLLSAIVLMGAQLQYMGRILGTANIKSKYYAPMLVISVINAMIAMLVMRFIVK